MTNLICLGLVILSYAVGHMSGYKLCKLRIKNYVSGQIKGKFRGMQSHTQAELDLYASILSEVMAL